MKTFTKVLLTGAVLATLGAGAAMARMEGRDRGPGGPGGPFGGPMGERMFARLCSDSQPPMDGSKMAEHLTKKLTLTDAQKTALSDLQAAFAKSHSDVKTALCADKPDFATMPGRMAFGIKAAEVHINGMKQVQPKLEAFYATLTDAQKKSFDEMGPWGRRDGHHWGWMHRGDGPQDDQQ